MRGEEHEISVYLWLSVNMFIDWVENIGSLGQQLRKFPKCSVILVRSLQIFLGSKKMKQSDNSWFWIM